jgi:hypothetical protein
MLYSHLASSLHATVRRCAQVVNEFENCLATIRAVASLHTSDGKTSFQWTKEDGEPWTKEDGKIPKVYALKSVGTARLAFFLLVQACRLTIASALCYGGSYFIAHTIGLGDLILNCVALEVRTQSGRALAHRLLSADREGLVLAALCQFVMEVDEMLFEAFAPKRLKNVLQHAKNLEVKPLRRFFGLDLSPVFKLLLTGLMIGLMAGLSIAPQTQYLRDAGDAMCGTRLDPCCYAMHLLLTRGARSAAGGPLTWAFGMDKVL